MKKLQTRTKKTISLIVAIIGVILVLYSISAMRRIAEAKGNVSSFSSATSRSAPGRYVQGELNAMASQYDVTVRSLLISGCVLIVLGCAGWYMCRGRR